MASEILAVSEEDLLQVIQIIRNGLKATRGVPKDVKQFLKEWCDEEEAYMKGTDGD